MDPETAIAALLAYLQANLGSTFKTIGRRLIDWTKVSEQPALFIRHENNEDIWQGVGLRRTTVSLKLWLYAKTGPDDVPDTILNNLITALSDALAPDDYSGEFTLGQTVGWVRLEGTSEYYPGDIADQAIAVVPISMLLTM